MTNNTGNNGNGKNPYPTWFTEKECAGCNTPLRLSNYYEIGFYTSGPKNGNLFIRYNCENCSKQGVLEFGDENFTIEKLCTIIIEQSKFLEQTEKTLWKRKNIL